MSIKTLADAPSGRDVILYLHNGFPPIIAGLFSGCWQTCYDRKVDDSRIIGWDYIPNMPPGYY